MINVSVRAVALRGASRALPCTRFSRRLLSTALSTDEAPAGSHPNPLRLPACHGARGLRWLDAGITHTVVETRTGLKLRPGLHGLDLRDWLLLGEPTRGEQMDIRTRALADPARRPEVLQADDPSTFGAQHEVLELVQAHMAAWAPRGMVAQSQLCSVGAAVEDEPPLAKAARLVQEDFVLLHDGDGDFHAAAAAVFFSFGDLPRRISERYSMAQLHAKVGNYQQHLHAPVLRLLGGLVANRPVWRSNWSLVFTDALEPTPDRYLLNLEKRRRIFPDAPLTEWDGPQGALRRFDVHGVGKACFVKVEYQTVRRLERHSAFVLFTVHTHITPLSDVVRLPRAAEVLAANVRRASELDFRHYKGLSDQRIVRRVLGFLEDRPLAPRRSDMPHGREP